METVPLIATDGLAVLGLFEREVNTVRRRVSVPNIDRMCSIGDHERPAGCSNRAAEAGTRKWWPREAEGSSGDSAEMPGLGCVDGFSAGALRVNVGDEAEAPHACRK